MFEANGEIRYGMLKRQLSAEALSVSNNIKVNGQLYPLFYGKSSLMNKIFYHLEVYELMYGMLCGGGDCDEQMEKFKGKEVRLVAQITK